MSQCLLIKIVTSKDVPQSSPSRLFLAAFEKNAVGLQTFTEQLAIHISHHTSALKGCLMQMKSAHNQNYLHKVRVVNPLIIMQMCDIYFKNFNL